MIYQVRHITSYHYLEPVSMCHNLLHLRPRICRDQRCIQTRVQVEPMPRQVHEHQDYFGNPVSAFSIQNPHKVMTIVAEHLVERKQSEGQDVPDMPWEQAREILRSDKSPHNLEAYQFTFPSRYVPLGEELAQYACESFQPGRPMIQSTLELNQRIFQEFKYDPQATTISTPIRDVLANRKGVCQDFAHLMIGCLRSIGLAARYVSGYLLTTPPPGKEKLVGADATHAWLSAYLPGYGWVDFDPTNNLVPSDKHITLAWGRDYDDISPIKGVILGGGSHSMKVEVTMTPSSLHSEETPSIS
jgi:transglutaminase-like putative cysteine protease